VKTGIVLGNEETGFIVVGLAPGKHLARIIAWDCCGNETVHEVEITIVDNIPPVPVCDQHTVVSMTSSASPSDDYVCINASTFDDGSYDNCNDVWFKVIRMEDLLGTVNGSTRNNTVACGVLNGDDDLSRSGIQKYFDDEVCFCCADVGDTVTVVFRVFDVDPGVGPVSPAVMERGRLKGRFTDCMVQVEVQNKSIPQVVAPDDVVVTCSFWFDVEALEDPNDATFGRVVTDINARQKIKTNDVLCERLCEDIVTHYLTWQPGRGVPAVSTLMCQYVEELYDPAHPEEVHSLVWGYDGFVYGACGAQPVIRVNDQRECGQGLITRTVEVRVNGQTYRDQQQIWVVDCDPFYIDPENCTSTLDDIEWPNGCRETIEMEGCGADLDPSNPLLGKPEIVGGADDQCAFVAIDWTDDTIVVEDEACFKVIRDWRVIDWCQWDPDVDLQYGYVHPHPGEWHFRQIILVRDHNAPEVSCSVGECEPLTYRDTVINGERYCVGHVELRASAEDECSPTDWLVYDYKIDLFNDGTGKYGSYDVYVGKAVPGERASEFDNPWADDEMDPTNASGTYPVGEHMIQWFVEDGCGNVGVCTLLFEVRDCKEPTPYCETGIVTVVMPASGTIEVWAKDLDAGSFDNCTAQEDLKFYFNGDPNQQSIVITCDTFEAHGASDRVQVVVEMWVEDEAGNTDYCETTIEVQDNQDVCPDPGSLVTTVIEATNGEDEEGDTRVMLKQGGTMMMDGYTSIPGVYQFAQGGMTFPVEIEAENGSDVLTEVSTRDIIAIQKYLLGLIQLKGYQYIAADVTNDQRITGRDIVQLRNVILGRSRKFPNNSSWRFALAGSVDEDEVSYKKVFGDWVERGRVDRAGTEVRLKAIKIGNVDDYMRIEGSGTRGMSEVVLEIESGELGAGIGEIAVRGVGVEDMSGLQLTLRYDREVMKYVGIEGEMMEIGSESIHEVEPGVLLVSYARGEERLRDGGVMFRLKFEMKEGVRVEEGLLSLGSGYLSNEGYDESLAIRGVRLRYVEGGYALYQNVPNPFEKETVIEYRLPEAMPVTLTVYEVSGKVVLLKEMEGQAGLNKVVLKREELGESGVLYYQLDAKDFTATRKMILMK